MDTSKWDFSALFFLFSIAIRSVSWCHAFSLKEFKTQYMFKPSDIQYIVDDACFVGFSLATSVDDLSDEANQELLDVYTGLRRAFESENKVIIGLTNTSNFVWPSGKPLKYIGDDRNDEDSFYRVLVFLKVVEDRTCLSVGTLDRPEPKPLVYDGIVTLNILIAFVNENCDTYQNIYGHTNLAGLHRNEILSSLFHVKNISDLSTTDLLLRSTSLHAYCTKDQCLDKSGLLGKESLVNFNDTMKTLDLKHVETAIPKCEKIDLPSKEFFFHNYLKISKPVIIRNAIDSWPAISKWTNEYFKQELGNHQVHLKLTPSGEFEGVDLAKNFLNFNTFSIPENVQKQLPFPDMVVVRPATMNLNISEFIDTIESVASGKKTGFSAYLEYSSITDIMQELENDIEEMSFFNNLLQLKHGNIWLSDGNTLGKLHFDPFDNFLCQLSGRKQVILYDPHRNERLYEGHIPEAMLSYDEKSGKFSKQQLVDTTSMVMSPVDIQNPNLERFPLFGETYPLNCTIDEGEVLFMPSFWWHEVQSYPNIQERRNLAVNFWYEPFLQKEFPCQECRLDVNPKYRFLL